MELKIKKSLSETLMEKLQKDKDRNAELAGYGILPVSSEEIVFNVPDSSLYKEPNNNTCIGYWEEQTGFELSDELPYFCPACNGKMSKKESNLDGAHVYKKGNPKQWFFMPLCSTCNKPQNTGEMKVRTTLVPVPQECYEKKQIEQE